MNLSDLLILADDIEEISMDGSAEYLRSVAKYIWFLQYQLNRYNKCFTSSPEWDSWKLENKIDFDFIENNYES